MKLLHEYGSLCRYKNVPPTKVILTFAPIGREKTLKFIRWLGVNVPAAVEERILGAGDEERKARSKEENVAQCVQILCECLRTILMQTSSAGVPLGVSVESVSIFKEEIDAAHVLFAKLQAIMLDAHGCPWKVKWAYTLPPTAGERAVAVMHAAATQAGVTTAAAAAANAQAAAVVGRSGIALDLTENQIVQVLLALAVGFLIGAHRSS